MGPGTKRCRRTMVKATLIGLVVLALAAGGALLSQQLEHSGWVDAVGDVPWVAAGPLAAVLIVLAVPSPLISTILGVAYGPFLGSGVALLAVVLAAAIKLIVLRRCTGARAERAMDRFAGVRSCLRRSAFTSICIARIAGTPLIALAAMGAIGRASLVTFLTAVALSSAPKIVTYAAFGGAIDRMPQLLVAGVAIGIASLGYLVARRAGSRVALAA